MSKELEKERNERAMMFGSRRLDCNCRLTPIPAADAMPAAASLLSAAPAHRLLLPLFATLSAADSAIAANSDRECGSDDVSEHGARSGEAKGRTRPPLDPLFFDVFVRSFSSWSRS